jgi:hypothetical protein
MNLTAEFGVVLEDVNNNQQHTQIHYALIGNRPITNLLIYVVREINKFVDTLCPDTFSSAINYL